LLLDLAHADPRTVYQTLISVVTPRPIAWVTSVDLQGRVNLAPFSFYNAFSASPPIVVFSPGLRGDGTKKDTLRNVEATGEFVLNAAVAALAEQMNLSSKELPYGESEVELSGLTLQSSLKVKPPRLAETPVAMECVVRQIIPLGGDPGSGNLVIGEVLVMHVEERVLDSRGRVDPHRLETIGRLGGDLYARTTDIFEMKRPK